jgi:hypothetical protein
MKYKGREVTMVRPAAKTDPYYDAEFDQSIVEYTDGSGRETVKNEQLVEDEKLVQKKDKK